MKFRSLLWAISAFLFPISLSAADNSLLIADGASPVVQNEHADADDLSRMHDVRMVKRFARGGYLHRVPSSTAHFYLHDIPVEYRYSRPWTKLFLTRLSRQYFAKFGRRLRVTSLVRTEGRQMKLARRNSNAADSTGPLRSSHLTGATLDISKRFMSAAERRWMRDVLYSLRQQGYLYAIEEFTQPTFHIMVYRGYPQYVRFVTGKARPLNAQSKKPVVPTVALHASKTPEAGE